MVISRNTLLSLMNSNHFFDELTTCLGVPMQKYNEGVEYEIKLNYTSPFSVVDVNRKISDKLERYGYFSNRCEKQSDYIVNYLQSPLYDCELSVFLYEERPLMKMKNILLANMKTLPYLKVMKNLNIISKKS